MEVPRYFKSLWYSPFTALIGPVILLLILILGLLIFWFGRGKESALPLSSVVPVAKQTALLPLAFIPHFELGTTTESSELAATSTMATTTVATTTSPLTDSASIEIKSELAKVIQVLEGALSSLSPREFQVESKAMQVLDVSTAPTMATNTGISALATSTLPVLTATSTSTDTQTTISTTTAAASAPPPQKIFEIVMIGGGGGGGGGSPPPPAPPAPVLTPPGAPTALIATAAGESVLLTWAAPSSDGGSAITDYVIHFSTDNFVANDQLFADGVSTVTNATVTGLTNGVGYAFRVVAKNTVGEGTASGEVGATPANVPSAVSNLSAVRGANEATLSWSAPAANGSTIVSYTLFYSADSFISTSTFSGATLPSGTTVGSLTNGTSYSFKVVATNSMGTSNDSNLVSATPANVPAAIADLSAPSVNETDVTISWSEPAANGSAISGYQVFYSIDGFISTTTFSGAISPVATSVTGLSSDTTYGFKVFATNGVGTSAQSNILTVTTSSSSAPPPE